MTQLPNPFLPEQMPAIDNDHRFVLDEEEFLAMIDRLAAETRPQRQAADRLPMFIANPTQAFLEATEFKPIFDLIRAI